jgi:hypothetical protein
MEFLMPDLYQSFVRAFLDGVKLGLTDSNGI